ncbi:MAG TPA: UvrB/UvrC motif-containing protein [Candidatus Acidoferrales bacterium]|nr:UvrB/UvrC motif-containing protein [Candidatus Acidoferrales bacterium]
MLGLDCGQEFDLTREDEFFASVPLRPGVLLIEMRATGAQPHILRTADLRRAAERLLRLPEPGSKRLNLRDLAARIRYRVSGSKFEQTLTLYENAKACTPGRYRDLLRLRPPAVLKVNLRNDYPRCYVTRRIRADEGFYFGPFPSRRAAESFSEKFLDLFKIRRCQIRIRRDPGFPGCIYSEMKMCLAPCFAGCTREEYDAEAHRVVETLATSGESLTRQIEEEREAASAALDFERAAALHKRIDKVSGVLGALPDLPRRIEDLDAVILQRAAEEKTVAVFPLRGGLLAEPLFVNFGELSSQPRSAEAIVRQVLEPLRPATPAQAASNAETAEQNWRARYGLREAPSELAEHLSLVARWFYSNPRDGEILFREDDWPYRRILRACGRVLAPPASPALPAAQS